MTLTEAIPTQGAATQAPETNAAPSSGTVTEPAKTEQATSAQPAKQPEPAKAVAEQKAPDKYEFKAAEGQEFDAQVLAAYGDVATELGLSQEAAQKVLDKVAPVLHQRQLEGLQAVRDQWAEIARTDKEFGGDKLPESMAVAKQALQRFGSPQLVAWLNESGLGNHPEMIRAWWKAGLAIAEERVVMPSADGTASPRVGNDLNQLGDILYGKKG